MCLKGATSAFTIDSVVLIKFHSLTDIISVGVFLVLKCIKDKGEYNEA